MAAVKANTPEYIRHELVQLFREVERVEAFDLDRYSRFWTSNLYFEKNKEYLDGGSDKCDIAPTTEVIELVEKYNYTKFQLETTQSLLSKLESNDKEVWKEVVKEYSPFLDAWEINPIGTSEKVLV